MTNYTFARDFDRQSADTAATLRRLDRISRLLDSAFRIPGTRIRVGLDPVLGFVPGIGEAITTILSGWLILQAVRLGLPMPAILRMVGNVAVDTTLGAVPLAGDVVDIFWKANRRNMDILRAHLADRTDPTAGPVIDGTALRLD
jgi:hypothetical protein